MADFDLQDPWRALHSDDRLLIRVLLATQRQGLIFS